MPTRRRRDKIPGPVVWAIVFAVLAVGAWRVINFVMAYADSEAANNPLTQMSHALEEQKLGKPSGAEPQGGESSPRAQPAPTAEPPEEEQAGPAPDEASAVEISHDDYSLPAPAAPRRASASGKKRAAAGRETSAEWRLRGTVYDLVTLKPVAGIRLTLKDAETSRSIETMTDRQGRYRLLVPQLPGRGYSVVFNSPKYASSYLNPDMDNVRQKSQDERAKMAADLAHDLNPPYSVQGYGNAPFITDFYLAPRRD